MSITRVSGTETVRLRPAIEFLTNKQSMTSTKTRAVYKQIIDEINQNISNFIGEVNFID